MRQYVDALTLVSFCATPVTFNYASLCNPIFQSLHLQCVSLFFFKVRMQVTWSLSMLLFNLMSRRPQYLLECNFKSWVCTACRSREFSKISLRPSRTNMLLVQGVAHTTLRREGHLAGPFVWGPGFNLVPWTLLKQRAQERSRDCDTRIVHSLVYFWAIVGPGSTRLNLVTSMRGTTHYLRDACIEK